MKKIEKVLFVLYRFVFKFSGIVLPKKSNLVIFESFLGKQYSDNPRAIYEYLQENYPQFEMYWSADKRLSYKFKESNIKYARRFSVRWIFLMNRAGYWITNSRLPLWIPKPTKTTYIQTWHGTPLKRLAADMDQVHMPGANTVQYKKDFILEAKKWDYLISPNSYSTEIFRQAFNFNNKIIESGYPRNDFLINKNNENQIENIKVENKLPLNKKIILYAPTWRDNQFYEKGRYKFDLEIDLEMLQKNLSENYIIVLRMHYLISENLDLNKYKGFVYDLTFHEDIRELYLIADLLITDYSSVFFDYAILKRPMIFYVYDIEEYRDILRGFYMDFEKEAPGPLVKTTGGILDEILKVEYGHINTRKINSFYNKYCYLEDGQTSKRVIRQIFNIH